MTHDQAEALSLADTVAVMRDGRVEQVGTPEEIYERPRSRWVAEFLGEADVLPGHRQRAASSSASSGASAPAPELAGRVDVVIRPESVGDRDRVAATRPTPRRVVVGRSFYGHDQLVHARARRAALRLRSRRLGFPAWHPGDRVRVWIDGPVSAVPEARAGPAGPRGRARRRAEAKTARRRRRRRCG